MCSLVFKIICNKTPDWLYNFPTVNSVNDVNTRQGCNLYVERTRTDVGSRQFCIRGPAAYNKLPLSIKNAGSVATFNRNLRNVLLGINT